MALERKGKTSSAGRIPILEPGPRMKSPAGHVAKTGSPHGLTPAIRRAVPGDARAIHEAHMRSIREVCAKDYSEEQIRAWAGREFRQNERTAAITRDSVWVVEAEGRVAGYAHLMDL